MTNAFSYENHNKLPIYTSSWNNYFKLIDLGYDVVSISQTIPKELRRLKIVTIRDVVPPWNLINMVKYDKRYDDYIELYKNQLNKLNPYQVNLDVMGRVLMCYEEFDIDILTPRLDGMSYYGNKTKFCHRHILSEWLSNNGYPCRELQPHEIVNLKEVKK